MATTDVTDCRHRVIWRDDSEPAPCPTCGGQMPNADLSWVCRDCGQKWLSPVHPTVAAGGHLCGVVWMYPPGGICYLEYGHTDDHDVGWETRPWKSAS